MVLGKAAVFVEPYRFDLVELPPVPVEPGGIRVKITAGGICGSDLHFWRGEIKPIIAGKPGPVILGHEMAGYVDAMGIGISTDSTGKRLKEGDRVVFTYYFPCMRCYNCLRGELNHCPTRFRFRASINEFPYCNGGFAEYYYLFPGHFVFKVPDDLSDEAVASANCAASQAVYSLMESGMQIGDSVVVQGAGGLGIVATAASKDMGAATVTVIDGVPGRLEFAKQCGADYTIDINEYRTPDSRIEKVKQLTDGRGADVVIEMVGYPQAFAEGLEMVRHGGTYVEAGNIFPDSNVTVDVSKILWNQAKIVPVTHYQPQVLPITLDFLNRTKDRFPLTKLMSHRFPLEEIGDAFKQTDWAGKNRDTGITRAFVTP